MPPKGKKLTAAQKLQRDIEEYTRVMKGEAGPLIGRLDAARVLGISRQRVMQLVQAGRLQLWEFFDDKYVSLPAVLAFRKLERGPGTRYDAA